MKGVSFSDMRAFYAGKVSSAGKSNEMANGESFMQVFDKTQGQTEEPDTGAAEVKNNDAESIQNHANIQKKNVSEPVKEVKEDIMSTETIEEAATEIKEKIAEIFDVSVEEVEDILEILGLSTVDLLNNEVLTQVVMELNPGVDALQLMTNEDLYADFKSLMDFAQGLKTQLCEQFQMSEEELKTIMDTFKEIQQVQSEQTELVEEAVAEEVLETVEADKVSTISQSSVDFVEQTVIEKATVDKQAVVEPIPVKSTESKQENSNETASGNENGQEMFKNFFNQLSEAVESVSTQNTSYGTSGQDIIRQITDYIKVHVKPDTTEMELQLHPASLGTVKVQLASTGGVLTAIFTTENESVKAALEAQLIQLKDNFAQQGLKVESIEVNVSAQGFERSLDQQEREQNSFEEAKSKKGNRRIRLSDIGNMEDISLEDIAEEDKVVADMMIRNGNTVDYTV